MWVAAVGFLKRILGFLKKPFVAFILKAAGLSGGIVTWIATYLIGKGIDSGTKELDNIAHEADQTAKDEELEKKYQEDLKNGASEEELIKDETDILNGGRRNP